MSHVRKIIVAIALIWCVCATASAAHRTTAGVLLGLFLAAGLLFAIVAAIACAFADWRRRRWRSLLPLGVCVISLFVPWMLVPPIRHALFVWSLPSYEAIVQRIESGSIPLTAGDGRIVQAEPGARLTYRVVAQRATNGALTVIFFTEEGFPALHSGYLYSSSGDPGSRWPIVEQVRSNWFFISN
jgi:hypothetical protein